MTSDVGDAGRPEATPAVLRLLNIIEAESAAFSLCEVSKGAHLVGAPFDGVGAYLVLAGTLQMRGSGGAVHTAQTDSLMLLPAGQPPSMTADLFEPTVRIEGARSIRRRRGILVIDACEGRSSALTVAAARIVGSGQQDLVDPLVLPLTGTCAHQLLHMLRTEFAQEHASGALAASLMSACVALALREAGEAGTAPHRSNHHDASVARTVAAMTAQLGDAHSTESLAAVANMSRSTFLRQFARIMGCSPSDYLLRMRLKEAAAMLRSSSLPVQEIAEATGFASRSHFSRAFRHAFDLDPSTYRQVERVAVAS